MYDTYSLGHYEPQEGEREAEKERKGGGKGKKATYMAYSTIAALGCRIIYLLSCSLATLTCKPSH